MAEAQESWRYHEGENREVMPRWEGKIEIPMVDCMIDSAIAMVQGKRLEKKDIAEALGISPAGYSNKIKDGLCTFDFISDVCSWLNIPVYSFAQVSELSPDYNRTYAYEPAAAFKDFEDGLRHFLRRKASYHPYQDVFDRPTFYLPPDSADISLTAQKLDLTRGAMALDAEVEEAGYRFEEGDYFRFTAKGPPGRHVILLETQMTPYADYNWGLLNGVVQSKGSLIKAIGSDGMYHFDGRFMPPLGLYRVTLALLHPEFDSDRWRHLKAGEACPDYLLNGLAEEVRKDDSKCRITTFTYELNARAAG